MTREQAKQNLIALGISEPSDEQVSNYLNSVNGEVQKEKEKNAQYKADADKVKDLQKQLDDIEASKLSDMEKLQKQVEQLTNDNADLKKKDAIRTQRADAMAKFKITSEQSNLVVKDDGSFDMDALGQIISEKETASANAKEQEIANNSSNPGGGSAGGKKEDEKPADVANAESITFGGVSKDAQSARDYYK